jgi:hypothetical protein
MLELKCMCSCQNCVVCSEAAFAVEIVLSATNELSLSNSGFYNELVFVVEIVLSTANQRSLLNFGVCSELAFIFEVCCLQRISIR